MSAIGSAGEHLNRLCTCGHVRGMHRTQGDHNERGSCAESGCTCLCMSENGMVLPAWAKTPTPDVVNHPPHYTSHPSGVECIAVTEHMGFCIGNAIKYLWRAGLKGESHIEDLKKARWYVDREIERLSKKT